MRVVNTGNTYRIYNNSLKTFDQLPAQAYSVCFHPQQGFWLEKFSDLEVNEKIYGVHMAKVEKVFNSFKGFSRNLGIILSGDKGIGKSLFAKLLCIKSIENNYPLIIVNNYIPGIADFLNEIEQEVVVLFDEFDKTFYAGRDNNSAKDPQTEMLTLFDGISMGKKLFVITCNDLRSLNDYLVNRPGRFHYHFRFEYPQAEEIREYLQDKLEEQYWGEINEVINFSKKINLNYDCLRAIAFELALGLKFKEAISDLNIVNITREVYDLCLFFADGTKMFQKGICLNMFDDDEVNIDFDYKDWYDIFSISFSPVDNTYSLEQGGCVIPGDKIKVEVDEDYKESSNPKCQEVYEKFSQLKPQYLLIKKQRGKDIHYAV